NGISDNGGLYVPEKFPQVSREELEALLEMSYAERAAKIIGKYLDEFDASELLAACEGAYSRFERNDPAPLVKIDDGVFMLELWHGPTCAFKDMALTLLPYLLRKSSDICGVKEEILILVATSGDTGKAALEGFKDADGVKICVFYPSEGVSKMQKLQMSTQDGKNVNVVAVKGHLAVYGYFAFVQFGTARFRGLGQKRKTHRAKNVTVKGKGQVRNYSRRACVHSGNFRRRLRRRRNKR
ncbi:MAG: hypothetical protein OSJ68_09540, partial [Clostridia bacterium]|nr:hypothetical protein [Clostridia bacterium]